MGQTIGLEDLRQGAGGVSQVVYPRIAAPVELEVVEADAGHFERIDPPLFWRGDARICEFLLRCSMKRQEFMIKDFTGELFVPQ
jgi:hypothetical protein